EELLEAVVGGDAGLHHLRQRAFRQRLGGDLEIAAGVVLRELLDVLGRFDGEVVTHARGDQHFAYSGERARRAVQTDERGVIRVEIRADARVHAGGTAASALDLAALAGKAVHVGGRSAEIGDDPGESRDGVAHRLDLAQHRVLRAALDDAALVLGDRAEGAAAEAAALDRDREADHLVGGDV